MHAFWEIVASNALLVSALAVAVALVGRVWRNPAALHLLWVFVLLKLVTPPVVTLPVSLPVTHTPLASEEHAANHSVAYQSPVATFREEEASSATGNRRDQRAGDKWAIPRSIAPPIDIAPSAAERPRVPWLLLLAWTWAIGIAALASAHAYRIHRFLRLLAAAQAPPSAVLNMAERIGKQPIETKDRSGFIVNMLLVPYLMAAVRMYEEGFATREDIDAGMRLGCGHPMGPLALCDLIGLDVLYAVCDSLFEEFKRDEYAPPPLLKRMLASDRLGRKSGRGFYDYAEGASG